MSKRIEIIGEEKPKHYASRHYSPAICHFAPPGMARNGFYAKYFRAIGPGDYDNPVFLIAKCLIHAQIQRNCNAAFLFIWDTTFAIHRRAPLVSTFETFTGSVPGYLHLVLGLRRTNDFLEIFVSEGREHSILSGWFITPWAQSVLSENQIDGLVMDMTWNVMGQYVTAMSWLFFMMSEFPWLSPLGQGKRENYIQCFTRLFRILSN
jgi:hypothetical protein